jgi:hypothetical protein
MATPDPTTPPPIEDLVDIGGTIDVRTVGGNHFMGGLRRAEDGWRAYDQTEAFMGVFDRYELARQAVEDAYIPPPPTPRNPDRPRLFAAYTFQVHVPAGHVSADDEADQLLEKLAGAFDKAEGALRNLLAEIDPALTLTQEEA